MVRNILIGIAVLLTLDYARAETRVPAPPAIQGTFLQLWSDHGEWQPEDWKELFHYFQQLGISQVVIQWMLYDETAFYSTTFHDSVSKPPLKTILRLADEAGMKVLVGLANDPDFWEEIEREPESVEVYLQRLLLRSASVADQLTPMVLNHTSFQGWFVCEEVNGVNWRHPKAREALFAYLRDLSARLHELTPQSKVALSGFASSNLDPRAVKAFWNSLLKPTTVDIVLFQDGVGTGKIQYAEVPLYMSEMQAVVEAHSRELIVVLEIFSQVDDATNDSSFKAVPASLARIKQQIDASAPYSTGTIAFSVPEYMTPLGGKEAQRLYQDYLEMRTGSKSKH